MPKGNLLMQSNSNFDAQSNSRTPPRVNSKRIVWWTAQNSRGKILQVYNKGLEYSILSDKYEQCHGFVWCKDFLHDVVYSSINSRPFEIYRFSYDPCINPKPCVKQTRILIANARDSKFIKKIPSVIDFINQIEDRIGIPPSIARRCINPLPEYSQDKVCLIQGHKRWIMSPPMLSLYTLLIRIGFAHFLGQEYQTTIKALKEGIIKPYQTKDNKLINEIEAALHKIIRIGDKKLFYRDMKLNYPNSISVDTMHNRMGIASFANDMIAKNAGQPVMMPYWHLYK